MFLEMTIKRNYPLVQWGMESHQQGKIPPDTYVIDLDSVRENALQIKKHAEASGLELYFMTKQVGRNPAVVRAITEAGIEKAVAVSLDEARILRTQGVKIGHIGHLVQIPKNKVTEALRMNPEVVTVADYDNAVKISDAARRLGRTQPILLRVYGEGDFLFPGQEGGLDIADFEENVRRILSLPNVSIAGVTSFPCLQFEAESGKLLPTPNLTTLGCAAAKLKALGIEPRIINAPGANCVASFPLLKKIGATHAEPGHAFTGTTPLHSVDEQCPERPSIIYVTEVSHTWNGYSFVFGGGFYGRSNVRYAWVGGTIGSPKKFEAVSPDSENIDYYGKINGLAKPGDTAVYAFRTQMFVTRSRIAVVEGLHSGKARLIGLFDREGRPL